MLKIHWLPDAQEDLVRLHEFIFPHSAQAANDAIEKILQAVEQLSEFPEIGQFWEHDAKYREWFTSFGARGYVVRYFINQERIIIARIWHTLEER